jgi:hypothetical protein
MAYLLSEILGSLIVVALVAFTTGWVLRGLRDRFRNRRESAISDDLAD